MYEMKEVKDIQNNFEQFERICFDLNNASFQKTDIFKNRVCRVRNCKERGIRYTKICNDRYHSSFYMR